MIHKVDHRPKYESETIKIPEESGREHLCDIEVSKDFLNRTQNAPLKITKLDFGKIKYTMNKVNKQVTAYEKVPVPTFDK